MLKNYSFGIAAGKSCAARQSFQADIERFAHVLFSV
jgi:hypothetical protein